MRTLDKFLKDEFSVDVDIDDYLVIVNYIKEWPSISHKDASVGHNTMDLLIGYEPNALG